MSVTIMWAPIAKDRSFKGGTSSDLAAIRDTFGDTIDESHLPTLEAMARVGGCRELLREIIEAVESHGSIRVWGEY